MSKVCDVYATSKREVTSVAVYLQPLDEDGKNDGMAEKLLRADLSPRAIKRLRKFIAKAIERPTDRKKKETKQGVHEIRRS